MTAAQMVGIAEATRRWQVSERTLRRRLAQQRVEGAERDELGQWLIPSTWLDGEFEPLNEPNGLHPPGEISEQVIDLRDKTIADGLAEALSNFTDWTDRIVDAEVRAATAHHELASTTANLRRASDDLDHQRAERERLERDLADTTSALMVETDRRQRAEQQVADAIAALEDQRVEQRSAEATLRTELEESRRTLTALEAIASRRTRRKLHRVLDRNR